MEVEVSRLMPRVETELIELIGRAVGTVLAGAKRIEMSGVRWDVTAYRVITTIRVDIKEGK